MEEFEYVNGVAEDLGAVIGACALLRLMAVFGGEKIYVPMRADSKHVLCRVLGMPACRRLCEQYGGTRLSVPLYKEAEILRQARMVGMLIRKGVHVATIADVLSVSERTVRNLRARAEALGLLPTILRGVDTDDEACLGLEKSRDMRG